MIDPSQLIIAGAIGDRLPRHAAKERKGPLSANARIRLPATDCGHQEPVTSRLTRIGHNEHLTAVSQPEVRQLDRRGGSAPHDMLATPVKLRHITGRKEQRQKRLRARLPTRFDLPLPHMTLNAVTGTSISLGLKTFEQPTRRPPPCFGQKPITAQPLIKTAAPRPKLWPGLRLALANRLNPILQILANGVPRQLQGPRQATDTLAVPQPSSPDLPNRFHA